MRYPRGSGLAVRRAGLVAVAAVSATVLAACSPGASSSSSSSSAAGPASVATSASTAPVTLKLYDGQGLKTMDQALIAAFKTKFPNITINGTWDPDNVTTQNQPRQLASATPPDLVRVISVTGGVKDGLLTNLDPYATAYGWDKLPASQLSQFRAENGVAGSGNLYAKASGFTMTGLYYNKKLAAQIGMTTPPKTVADLTALLAKAKTAGLTGLVASNSAGGSVFPYQLMINSSMGPKAVAAWVFNAPKATIDTPTSVQAATVLQGWVNSGYLPNGVNGMDSTASDALFTSGKGVFYPWGNWDAGTFDKSMAGNVGFMAMPPVTAGGQVAAMSDAATAFGIPSKSANKDAAAQFLNFLSSDEARQIAIDNGFMPTGLASQAAPKIKTGSVLTDVVAAFNQVSAAAGQVPFVQNATPGISNQAWNPESQLLVAGKSTPQQFVTNVQAKYEDELK